jgi:hypothetical protein
VQWFKYSDSASSWEYEANINAPHLMKKFWEHLGIKRENYNGKLVKSKDEFIGGSYLSTE